MKRKYLHTIATLLLLIFLISCGGGGSSSNSGGKSFVQITLGGNGKPVLGIISDSAGLNQKAIPSDIYKISFTIGATDMTTVNKDILVAGQSSITETFSIENGNNRYFLLEAKNTSGTVLYKGSTTANLDGTPVTLDIVMVAQDITAPTVISTSPSNNATNVAITSAITVTFSETIDSSTFNLTLSDGGGNITGTTTTNNAIATFTPSSNLSYSTTYTVTITTDVKDSAGNAMASSYSWSFTTGATPDTTAPTITAVSPANGATGVFISNTTITATFSETMDSSTINTSTFTISGGITGTVTYSGTTATWTPSSNLSYSTTYTVTITTGVKDSAGNAMASNYSWSFTTGATPDTTAPTVSSVSPASGATGVAINTSITATFSETMGSSTITTATFTISGVSSTVSYSGTTATFTPSSNLSYSTTYTATITTGVKDSAGNAMASSYSWSFTTGSAPDTTAPSSPTISINSGASSIMTTSVTLTLSATDNVGVTGFYASETSTTPSASASGWTSVTSTTSYSANVSFTLSSAHGTKTVYVWFKDAAGNVSSSASDSIFLSRKAYVSDESGKVSVIDLISETESASIAFTGQDPYWIASSANGNVVAVSLHNDSVALINSSTNTLLGTVSGLGSEMEAVAVNSTGSTVYAADESSYNLYVINVGTMAADDPIDLSSYCSEPENMVISPDNAYLYITCASGGGEVIRVATAGFTINTIASGLSDPHGIALNSTGTRLYYTNGTNTYEYNTDTSSLTGTVFAGCRMYNGAISPDGSRLYCVKEGSTLSIYATSNGSLLTTVALGGSSARGVAVSLDGTRVYVPLSGTDSVKVINADTMALSGNIPVTGAYPTPRGIVILSH